MSSRWPLHPPPYPGEALSSWVNRIAHTLDVPPAALLRLAAPSQMTATGYHLDFDPPEEVLLSLAEGTGQPVGAVSRLTARGYVPSLLDTLEATEHGLARYTHGLAVLLPPGHQRERHPHILSWYSLHRFRQTHGCPDCLAETPEPYVRLHWRLAWMVTCPTHRHRLQPFTIHRSRGTAQVAWGFKEPHIPIPLVPLFMLDAITLQAITGGRCILPCGTVPGRLWIRLLRTVLDELGVGIDNTGPSRDRLRDLWRSVGRDYDPYLRKWRPYEHLYPKYQEMFLAMAGKAFSDAFAQPDARRRFMGMAQAYEEPMRSDGIESRSA
jgi:hypothetical protein